MVGMESKKLKASAVGRSSPTICPAAIVDMEREVFNTDHARLIKSAIAKLNANQQKVIELAYYEGLSQTEMAERMGQPLGTVKTWVRTALRSLRDELGEVATA